MTLKINPNLSLPWGIEYQKFEEHTFCLRGVIIRKPYLANYSAVTLTLKVNPNLPISLAIIYAKIKVSGSTISRDIARKRFFSNSS